MAKHLARRVSPKVGGMSVVLADAELSFLSGAAEARRTSPHEDSSASRTLSFENTEISYNRDTARVSGEPCGCPMTYTCGCPI